MIDEEKLKEEKELFAEGYFTLSHKVIRLSNAISGTKKRMLFRGLKKKDNFLHFILIGHLGKYINEHESQTSCVKTTAIDILDRAFEIIYQVKV